MNVFIYGLYGPDGVPRYVGQTLDLEVRFGSHMRDGRNKVRTHKANWIRSVWAAGGVVRMDVIEVCGVDEWVERETYWIAEMRRVFPGMLTNDTDGGEGASGRTHTAEAKAKIGAAHKGKKISKELLAKMHAGHVGLKHSPETRAKMSAAATGREFSDETRVKMSEAARVKVFTPEHRAAMSASGKRRRASEETKRLMSVVHSKRPRDSKGHYLKAIAPTVNVCDA